VAESLRIRWHGPWRKAGSCLDCGFKKTTLREQLPPIRCSGGREGTCILRSRKWAVITTSCLIRESKRSMSGLVLSRQREATNEEEPDRP
jgi:hypothetical protein